MCYEILRKDRYGRAIRQPTMWTKTCYERFGFQRYLRFVVRSHITILSPDFMEIESNKRMLSSVSTIMSEYSRPSYHGEWPEPTKFDMLRIKTDMQLVQLINIQLDLGIQDARQALKSVDTWTVAKDYHRRANRAYAAVTRLIPLVVEFTKNERSEVESRLEYLRGKLEALSAIGSTHTPTENEIFALARAVWVARMAYPKKIGFERNGH